MRPKLIYFCVVIFTIGCGLIARAQQDWFPGWVNLWLGDALYAFMMYYIVAIFLTDKSFKLRLITALVICYCIELSQLLQADWINTIRHTMPGRLILGQGFLWSDLFAYTAGVAAAFYLDNLWLSPNKATVGNSL